MADIPVVNMDAVGDFFTACAATGDTFDNTQAGTTLIIRNKNANPRTITFVSPNKCCFDAVSNVHDMVVTIPGDGGTNGMFMRVRLDPARFNNQSGYVTINYSAVAGLAIAPIQFSM